MKKINSFTLFELVLAMMLAGIVVGMAYTAFRLFTNIYGSYHDKTIAVAEIQALRNVLNQDLERASSVSASDFEVQIDNGSDSSQLRYAIKEGQLIRISSTMQDTFSMKGPVLYTSFESTKVSAGIVDHLVLKFDFENSPMLMSFRKEYTAQDLFNYRDTLWSR